MVAWQRTLNAAVDEVIDVANRENIEADIVKGAATRRRPQRRTQARRLRAEVDERPGTGNRRRRRAVRRPRRPNASGSITSCSARSTRTAPGATGEAGPRAGRRGGAPRRDDLRADDSDGHQPGPGRDDAGVVRAPIVLRATEGFTARMRRATPALATDEQRHDRDRTGISGDLWQSIGWPAETMGDLAHGFFLRPAHRRRPDRDRRPCGALPLRLLASTKDGVVGQGTIDHLTGVLNTILPQTRGVLIAHGWCGCWPCRGLVGQGQPDPATGLGEAGGYDRARRHRLTNLAGRTLTDLVLKRVDRTDRAAVGGHHQNLGALSRCAGWACGACTAPTKRADRQ